MNGNARLLGTAAATGALLLTSASWADEVSVFVNWSGAGCMVCNAADYAIPSLESWNGGIGTFQDPVPPGAVVVQMTAVAQGTGDDSLGVTVNGTPLGTTALVGTDGQCDSCWYGTPATSAVYEGGFPGYVAGGTNTMQLTAQGGIALDGVTLTIVYLACGDGNVAGGEECDTAGESATCDADCTLVVCGDGHVNAVAGEDCDVTLENAACDSDCTRAECGDGHQNAFAGEACDDGNTQDGDGCTAFCQVEGAAQGGGSSGDGGAGPGPGAGGGNPSGGGDGASGPSGPTATGGPGANGANGAGGGDGDGDGGSSGDGDANANATGSGAGDGANGSGSEGGCGCDVPARATRGHVAGAFALVVVAAAAMRRRRVR